VYSGEMYSSFVATSGEILVTPKGCASTGWQQGETGGSGKASGGCGGSHLCLPDVRLGCDWTASLPPRKSGATLKLA